MGIIAWVRVILGRGLQPLAHQSVNSSAQAVGRVGGSVSASAGDDGDGSNRVQDLRETPAVVGKTPSAALPVSLQLQMLSLVSSLIRSGRRLAIPPTLLEEECAMLAPAVVCCASAAATAAAAGSDEQTPAVGKGAARLPPMAGGPSGDGFVGVAVNAKVISRSVALLEDVQRLSGVGHVELGGGGGCVAGSGGIRLCLREARALSDASAACLEHDLKGRMVMLLASPGALRTASARGTVEEVHGARAMITWALVVACDAVRVQASSVAKVSVGGPQPAAQPVVWDQRPGTPAAMAVDVARSALTLLRILLGRAELGGHGDGPMMEFRCSTAESALALAGAAARLPRIRSSQAVGGMVNDDEDNDAVLWTAAAAAALELLTTPGVGVSTGTGRGSTSAASEYVKPVDTLRSRSETRFGCRDRFIVALSQHLRASNFLLPLFPESCHSSSDTLVRAPSGIRANEAVGTAVLDVCVRVTASMLAIALSGRRLIVGVAQQADGHDKGEGIDSGKADHFDEEARQEDAVARTAAACTQALQIVPMRLQQEPAVAAFVDGIRCCLQSFIGKT